PLRCKSTFQRPSQYSCAFDHARRAAIRPVARASRSPCSKWMPPYRREVPAWFAASEKVAHESVTLLVVTALGSILELPAGSVTETEAIAMGKELEDLCAGGAEVAVPGRVL